MYRITKPICHLQRTALGAPRVIRAGGRQIFIGSFFAANETDVDGGAARPARLMGSLNKRSKTEVKKVEMLPPTKTNNCDS